MLAGPRIVAALVVAGLVACVLVVIPTGMLGAERFALPKELVVHATAALAAIACIAGSISIIDRRLVPPLLGVLAWTALSFAVSDAPAWEAARVAGLYASLITVFACTRAVAALSPRALAWGIAAAVVLVAGNALLEAHGVVARTPLPPSGSIGNRNAAAHLLALGLPCLVAAACATRSRIELSLFAFAIALASTVVVLTRCRAAWLALVLITLIALAAMWLARTRPPGRRIVACAAAFVLGATIALVLPHRLAWSSASPFRDTMSRLVEIERGSGRGRILQYESTLAMAVEHPLFGVGPGNWSVSYPRYASVDDPSYQPASLFPVNRLPSSDWLGLLAMLGVPALGLLAWFAMRFAALAARRRSIAALATLACMSVLGAVDTVLCRAAPGLFAAIVLGALLPRHAGESDRGGAARVVIPIVLATACALFTAQSARLVAAAYELGDARAPRRLEAAARIAPGNLYFSTYFAAHLLRAGDCTRGSTIAARVLADYPHLDSLRELAQACEPTDQPGENDAQDDQGTDRRLRNRHGVGRLHGS